MSAQESNRGFKLEHLFGLKNRVALVTGGGSGIGLMATQALAVNGAKVYITGRTEEKLDRVADLYSKDIPGQIVPITADITSKESIQKLVDEISAKESKLHILINAAGISSPHLNTDQDNPKALQEELFKNQSTIQEWEDVMRTNVTHLFFTTTAFLPLLSKGSEDEYGWSSTVVNISSISGLLKTAQRHFAYNASKAAAIHLTKMLAYEIVSSKIKLRVNTIAPGVFPTEMTTDDSDAKQKSTIPKERFEGKIPAGRPGKDEDMATAVLFTVSNQYLNGQTIAVDGGYLLAEGTI
ncbi:hypothetical protein CBS147332_9180 [Penicillium roqueforti]|nr:hypothetical protein CBS147355_8119 [Penicillium roqueforti]KAI2694999.1 hypothetical protein CBS147372_9473 [Penicillium roqueforti]KAI2696091.1 hypothetical protein CBS147332_9180 [Penicillium roqueforti]KAI2709526.1 hypothetical protein CBS147318_9136 [Penicillium roqueforti]KAI3099251.1 hypothetical protein CBS147331_8661 [Penicillium roqueforti]